MTQRTAPARFEAKLRRPARPGEDAPWAFVILPLAVSETLPRRGRTTIEGTIDGHRFIAMLEPDGRGSHWLRIDAPLLEATGLRSGDRAVFEVAPVDPEPEPRVPADIEQALAASPDALQTWQATTTLARVDWIHWIVSAKQAKTRAARIANACDMLASGKRRVCCFDPSGVYSKALAAPDAVDPEPGAMTP